MKKDIITITKNAWGKLEQIINKSNNKHGFIFGVTSGGCNGFNFDLRLMQKEEYEGIQKLKPNVLNYNNVNVHIEPLSEMYLKHLKSIFFSLHTFAMA